MTQYAFGIGALVALRTDIANPTPAQFGTLQEASVDLSFTIKELTGQYQAPAALARAGLKITGKAKAAKISAANFNNIFFGQTQGTGQTLVALAEQATPSATHVTVANGATYAQDLGVVDVTSGVLMTPVASSPVVGVSYIPGVAGTGQYTFASGDAGQKAITYEYTTTGSGTNIALANQLMGSQPTFKLVLSETYQGKVMNLQLNSVIAPKLSLAFKNEDFMIPEFDFQAAADAAGTIGNVWLSE